MPISPGRWAFVQKHAIQMPAVAAAPPQTSSFRPEREARSGEILYSVEAATSHPRSPKHTTQLQWIACSLEEASSECSRLPPCCRESP